MAVILQSNLYIEDGPFDAGLKIVSTKEDLKTISDPYDGMIVTVTEEGNEGLYVLYHAADLSSWVKIIWDRRQSSIIITSSTSSAEFWKSLVTLQVDADGLTINPTINDTDTFLVFIDGEEQESVSGLSGFFGDLEKYQSHTLKIIYPASSTLDALEANIYIGDTAIWWPTEIGDYVVGELDNELNDQNFGEGVEYSLTAFDQSVNILQNTNCYYTYGVDRASALAVIDKPQSVDGNLNITLGTGQYVIVWLENANGEDVWKREQFIAAPSSSIALTNGTYADELLRQTDGLKLRVQEHSLEAYCNTTNNVQLTLGDTTTPLTSGEWTRIPGAEWNKKLSIEVWDTNNSNVGSATYEVVIGQGSALYPTDKIFVNVEGQFGDVNVSISELESGAGKKYTITAPSLSSVRVSSLSSSDYNFNLTEGVSEQVETAPSDNQDYYVDFLWEGSTISITEENSTIPSDLTLTITY